METYIFLRCFFMAKHNAAEVTTRPSEAGGGGGEAEEPGAGARSAAREGTEAEGMEA